MPQFKDAAGRPWTLAIDVPARKAVRLATDGRVDLFDAMTGKVQQVLAEDAELLVETLHALCKEQAEKLGVTPEQFGRAFTGQTLDDAGLALMEAIADFFQGRRGEFLRKSLAKQEETAKEIFSMLMDALDRPVLSTPTASSDAATSSAGSSGSNPAD